jgi:hypothetical protein
LLCLVANPLNLKKVRGHAASGCIESFTPVEGRIWARSGAAPGERTLARVCSVQYLARRHAPFCETRSYDCERSR